MADIADSTREQRKFRQWSGALQVSVKLVVEEIDSAIDVERDFVESDFDLEDTEIELRRCKWS